MCGRGRQEIGQREGAKEGERATSWTNRPSRPGKRKDGHWEQGMKWGPGGQKQWFQGSMEEDGRTGNVELLYFQIWFPRWFDITCVLCLSK